MLIIQESTDAYITWIKSRCSRIKLTSVELVIR